MQPPAIKNTFFEKVVRLGIYSAIVLSAFALLVLNLASIGALVGLVTLPVAMDFTKFFGIFGVSIAFMCALFWFGAIAGAVKLDTRTRTLLAGSFIAAVLSIAVAAIKGALHV